MFQVSKPQSLEKPAEKMGHQIYDIAIIGAGPAGLTAALYGARRKADIIIFESEAIGGQMVKTYIIENYPGILSITGQDLAERIKEQIERLGVKITYEKVIDIEKVDDVFHVKTDVGSYRSKTVILATGAIAGKLGFDGEEEFTGKGVSFCTICDGPLFKGKTVAVIGGGDSAAKAALFLTKYARKVYLIHRRSELRAEPYHQELLFAEKKIEILWNKVVKAVRGKKLIEKIVLMDTKTGKVSKLDVDGVFVEIGGVPVNILAKKLGVELDEKGYVRVDKEQRTNIPGFFAAGDITNVSLKQIVTAVAQGAIAATNACKYLGKGFPKYLR
jgi:thioredoxin reductase (NADPH)